MSISYQISIQYISDFLLYTYLTLNILSLTKCKIWQLVSCLHLIHQASAQLVLFLYEISIIFWLIYELFPDTIYHRILLLNIKYLLYMDQLSYVIFYFAVLPNLKKPRLVQI